VDQPIAFSHAVHHEQDIACLDCHAGAKSGEYATIPAIATCMLCHAEPQGDSPEEPRIREYADRGEPIPWVQVNRVVGHVYFSHAPHVTLAKIECTTCHGDMTQVDAPVTASQIAWLDMDACMDCHKERQVSNDCLLCHK